MVGQWQRTSASGNTSLSITSSIRRIICLRSNEIIAFNCQLAELHKVFATGWSLPLLITPQQVMRVRASRKMECKGKLDSVGSTVRYEIMKLISIGHYEAAAVGN